MPNFLREISIVARYELLAMIIGVKSLLLVVGYGVIAGTLGATYLFLDDQSGGQLAKFEKTVHEASPEQKEQAITELSKIIGRPILEAFANGDLPLIVIFVLVFSTFAIPGLVLLVGHRALAEDLSSKFARYVLQRVRRESWLIGKVLAHWAVSYVAIVLVHAALIAYGAAASELDWEKTLSAMPRIWTGLALFVFGYVSLTAVFSATISPPFAAFALGAVALFVMWVVSFIPRIGDVWMGSWHMQLWALDPIAIGIYLAYAIGLGGLAYVGLRRRDV